ncbi:hypothetical protein HDU79_006338 [Rhizoclosmatium sp. JEL0117]|nr:hypothetical protein HDU79_006338 [Rhizoclosmatium sp. JEL0117]
MLEVYIYLKRYLQALTSTYKPKSHIILKSNFHSHSLPSFLSVFPNARIITTHRQIPQVLPSLTLLTARLASLSTSQSTPLPRSTVTSFCTTELKHMSTSLLDLRRRVAQDWFTPFPNIATPPPSSNHAISSKQFFDVSHDALVRDPILTVKAIYKHFDMPFSADFEKAMREYVRMNPPFATRKVMGVEERRRVESAYGIPSMQELQESFADYHSYFGVD